MKFIGIFILITLLVLIGIQLYQRYQANQQKLKEREENRLRLFNLFKNKIIKIREANSSFGKLRTLTEGYLTNYKITTWKNKYFSLFSEIKDKSYSDIHLPVDEINSIKDFIIYYNQAENLRKDFNKLFIQQELKNYSKFFDNIEGRKLDVQQREAVITDEDNNLVIAGAGSGKTTTIVGKVNYVIDRYNTAPEKILLISFTNKSASSLANRINIDGIEAKTFHKFGKDIITEVDRKQPNIFDEQQFTPLLTKFFQEKIRDNSYLEKVTEYFIDYLKPPKSQFDFNNQGEYIQYIKDQNFRTYNQIKVQTNGKITYQMEVVKSIEECKIANFLLFNGIKYEYEYPYERDTATFDYRQYKPDFTIIQNGRKIYLEHFGVARNGNVPTFFAKEGESQEIAKERYWKKIQWARDLHAKNDTALIETYSYEMSEGILFDKLTQKLENAGIVLQPKTPAEVWNIIENAAKDEIKSFISLLGTFISLIKSNNYSIRELLSTNTKTKESFIRKRNELFIEIVTPIYQTYAQYLLERGEIDFNDMINKAVQYIKNRSYIKSFDYIIIDEFQDISIGRYKLVKALKDNNPSCKLFCVGDDWQSIYRFSGSDISLFKEFEKYFGYTEKLKIETTYRFHNPLINLSSGFIQKNPNQANKVLRSISQSKQTNYKIQYSITNNQDDTIAVKNIFEELLNTDFEIDRKEILILGRYSFDIKRIKNEGNIFEIDYNSETINYSLKTIDGLTRNLKAKFLTVHKAKGLEADHVIVLNCNSGKYGFPSEFSDDQILNLVLSEADQFENGEERRLFYVSMTRAKENVYFVSDSSYKSKFIAELEVETGQSPNDKCPYCLTADVVLRSTGKSRNGSEYKFYGCTNYLYGCEYTLTEWEN